MSLGGFTSTLHLLRFAKVPDHVIDEVSSDCFVISDECGHRREDSFERVVQGFLLPPVVAGLHVRYLRLDHGAKGGTSSSRSMLIEKQTLGGGL